MTIRFPQLKFPTPSLRDGSGLQTRLLEIQMMKHNGGIDLAEVCKDTPIDRRRHNRVVPYFGDDDLTDSQADKLTKGLSGPYSMQVDSLEELGRHMEKAYQVSHHHYILGKKDDVKESFVFPDNSCGISAKGVMLSLLAHGYPNAVYVCSSINDHSYVTLPFVFGKGRDSVEGMIVVDPTSDQMWDKPGRRNAVFIKLGSTWEYRTDWLNEANLYPDKACSVWTVKRSPKLDDKQWHYGIPTFYESTFENPIKVAI